MHFVVYSLQVKNFILEELSLKLPTSFRAASPVGEDLIIF
jgi:hypothetical protein